METTLENGLEYTYNTDELDNKVVKAIEKIENVIKNNNYQLISKENIFTEAKSYSPLDRYCTIEWKHLSQNQMKKIQKYCYWINRNENPSLRKINTFLSLLSRLFNIEKVRVKQSLKEEKIQNARKEWLKARDESDKLLMVYKLEKGNFYK
jgi:hypothetical protein